MASETKRPGVPVARDYRIVDTSNPDAATSGHRETSEEEAWNESMGTTYLLGKDGLTMIRRPAMEDTERLQSSSAN
ncbi:MAG: hypothetical protein ABSF28_03060 [Terracidiphilus sp.]|jgi:hypothetical protein